MNPIVALSLGCAVSLHLARRGSSRAVARRRLPPAHPATPPVAGTSWLDAALADSALEVGASTVWRAWIGLACTLALAAAAAGGFPLMVLVVTAVAGAPPMALRATSGRRDRIIESTLPMALDAVARSLRSGGSLRQAIEEAAADTAGPLGVDLARVAGELHDGVPLAAALERWSAERPLAGVRLATAALGLGAETGGASAQAIDGVAETLRMNVALVGEVRALSAQAHLSALVIALTPIVFTLLAAVTDGTTASFLLRTPVGLLCLCLGLGLDLVGGLWMRRLTTIVA